MKKLVIFDCDGVLVDSEIIANRIDAESLTAAGYVITAEESIRRFTGMNAESVRQKILKESGIELSLDFMNSTQSAILEAFEKELTPLMEDVLTALDKVSISCCVASSSPKKRVIYALERTGLFKFFNGQSIFTSQQVTRGKPAPDLFLFAADQMGIAPKHCVVIEDSAAGIQAAQAAGMQVIGFLGGTHARYEWYQEKIAGFKIPVAHSTLELKSILQDMLGATFE